jgi:hypothetical protein
MLVTRKVSMLGYAKVCRTRSFNFFEESRIERIKIGKIESKTGQRFYQIFKKIKGKVEPNNTSCNLLVMHF